MRAGKPTRHDEKTDPLIYASSIAKFGGTAAQGCQVPEIELRPIMNKSMVSSGLLH